MAIVMLLPGLWTAMTQVLSEQGQSAQIVVGARGGCKGKSAERGKGNSTKVRVGVRQYNKGRTYSSRCSLSSYVYRHIYCPCCSTVQV